MDMLYSKYSNPIEFMNMYINQGRFDEFVKEFLYIKRKEDEEKNERKLWELYLHPFNDLSFDEWKQRAVKKTVQKNTIDKKDFGNIIDESYSIMDRFNPDTY